MSASGGAPSPSPPKPFTTMRSRLAGRPREAGLGVLPVAGREAIEDGKAGERRAPGQQVRDVPDEEVRVPDLRTVEPAQVDVDVRHRTDGASRHRRRNTEAFAGAAYFMLTQRRDPAAGREIWLRYSRWLIAGLTFQLAADIISTSSAPSWQDVGQLAAIAVIRTFLNFFLERDQREMRESKTEGPT